MVESWVIIFSTRFWVFEKPTHHRQNQRTERNRKRLVGEGS